MTQLETIENAADTRFIELFNPPSWEPAPSIHERLAHGGEVLVLDDGAVAGFIHVLSVSPHHAHIEALAVRPESGRKGYGSALVAAALETVRGCECDVVTLRTYAGIAWNEGFYQGCGFRRWDGGSLGEEWTQFNDKCVKTEQGMGLMEYGERIVMVQVLSEGEC